MIHVFNFTVTQWCEAVVAAGILAKLTVKVLIPVLTFLLMKLLSITMDFDGTVIVISVAVDANGEISTPQMFVLDYVVAETKKEIVDTEYTGIELHIIQKGA